MNESSKYIKCVIAYHPHSKGYYAVVLDLQTRTKRSFKPIEKEALGAHLSHFSLVIGHDLLDLCEVLGLRDCSFNIVDFTSETDYFIEDNQEATIRAMLKGTFEIQASPRNPPSFVLNAILEHYTRLASSGSLFGTLELNADALFQLYSYGLLHGYHWIAIDDQCVKKVPAIYADPGQSLAEKALRSLEEADGILFASITTAWSYDTPQYDAIRLWVRPKDPEDFSFDFLAEEGKYRIEDDRILALISEDELPDSSLIHPLSLYSHWEQTGDSHELTGYFEFFPDHKHCMDIHFDSEDEQGQGMKYNIEETYCGSPKCDCGRILLVVYSCETGGYMLDIGCIIEGSEVTFYIADINKDTEQLSRKVYRSAIETLEENCFAKQFRTHREEVRKIVESDNGEGDDEHINGDDIDGEMHALTLYTKLLSPHLDSREIHFSMESEDRKEIVYELEESYCVEKGCDCGRIQLSVYEQITGRFIFELACKVGDNNDCDDLDIVTYSMTGYNPDFGEDSSFIKVAYKAVIAKIRDNNASQQFLEHREYVKGLVGRCSDTEDFYDIERVSGLDDGLRDAIAERLEAYHKMTRQDQPFIAEKKPGRNDPCSCGSGKKYKKCCL